MNFGVGAFIPVSFLFLFVPKQAIDGIQIGLHGQGRLSASMALCDVLRRCREIGQLEKINPQN
jgi:hypothetical protein